MRAWGAWLAWGAVLLVSSWASAQGVEVWPSPARVEADGEGVARFRLVAVNPGAEAARGVVLRDELPPGVELVRSVPAARVVGRRLEWSLGELAPGASASVEVELRGGGDAGAELEAVVGGSRRLDQARAVSVGALLPEEAEGLAPTLDADAADPEVLAVVSSVDGDPEALLRFVREEIGVEVYRGSLRGARGTLWSRAGNALDKANLLVALLRAAGVPARYGRVTLDDAQAGEVIGRMFTPRDAMAAPLDREVEAARALDTPGYLEAVLGDPLAGLLRGDPDTRAKLAQRPQEDPLLLAWAREHWVVELRRGGAWGLYDPTREVEPVAVEARMAALDPALRHKLTVSLSSEGFNPLFGWGSASRGERLGATLYSVQLAGRSLGVRHQVRGGAVPGLVFGVITYTYTPELVLDGEVIAQGDAFQELFSNFPGGTEVVTGVFLDVTVEAPGEAPKVLRHAILDRLGAAAREPGEDDVARELPGLGGQPAIRALDLTQVHVSVSKTPRHVREGRLDALDEAQGLAARLAPRVEELAAKEQDEGLSPSEEAEARGAAPVYQRAHEALGDFLGANYWFESDGIAERVAEMTLSRAYPARPRVVFVTQLSSSMGSRPRVDLADDTLKVVGDPEVGELGARMFRTTRGLMVSALEGRVLQPLALEGGEVVSAESVFQAAQRQGVMLRSIDPTNTLDLYRLDLPSDAISLMGQALARERWILTPERPVVLGGAPRLVWYEYDLATGEVISRGVNGEGPAAVEYAELFENFIVVPTAGAIIGFLPGYGFGLVAGIGSVISSKTLGSTPTRYDGYDAAGCLLAAIPKVGLPLAFSADSGAGILKSLDLGKVVAFMFALGLEQAAEAGAALFLTPPPKATLVKFIAGIRIGMCLGFMLASETVNILAQAIDPTVPAWGAGVPGPQGGRASFSRGLVEVAAPVGLQQPPTTLLGDALSVRGAQSLELGAGARLPAGVVEGEGELWRGQTSLGQRAWRLNAREVLPLGATLEGEGAWTVHRGSGAVSSRWTELEGTLGGGSAMIYADVDGQEGWVELRAANISYRAKLGGAALLPGDLRARVDGGLLSLGEQAWAGVTGEVALSGGVWTTDARASGRLALSGLSGARDLERGERLSFVPQVSWTQAGALVFSAQAPEGWEARWDAGRLEVTPKVGAEAGSYTLYIWARDPQSLCLAGGALEVVLRPSQGVEVTLARDPMLTDRKGDQGQDALEIPLVFRGEVVHRGSEAVTYSLTAQGEGGVVAKVAAPSVTLAPGERRVVYVSALPAEALPAPGAPVRVVLRAQGGEVSGEAEVALGFPSLIGASLTPEPRLFQLAPGQSAQAEVVLRPVGNEAGFATLLAHDLEHLRVVGLPERVELVPGQELRLPVTVLLGMDATPGLVYGVRVDLRRGEALEGIALVEVTAVGPEADLGICAASVARELGLGPLEGALLAVSDRLERAGFRCDPEDIFALGAAVEDLVAELSDPAFDDVRPAFIEHGAALQADPTCEADLGPLLDALRDLKLVLEALRDHDFSISLAPAGALLRPGERANFTATLTPRGLLPTSVELVLEGAPGSVQGRVALSDAPLQVPVEVAPDATGRIPIRVVASAAEAPQLRRAATALVVVEPQWARVVRVGADPGFAIPGARLRLYADVFNAANVPQDVDASVQVARPDGSLMYENPAPIPLRLPVSGALRRYELGVAPTYEEPEGVYRVALRLYKPGTTELIPGGEGEGLIPLGQPLEATLAAEPRLLPPGDVRVELRLDATRRPSEIFPGVRNPVQIQQYATDSAGPAGIALAPDGEVFFASFGTERSSDIPGYVAGRTIGRINALDEVSAFATVSPAVAGVAIGPDGAIYAANVGDPERITRVTRPGAQVSTYFDFQTQTITGGGNGENITGITFDAAGNLYATELFEPGLFVTYPGTRIYRLTPDGNNDGRADAASTFVVGLQTPTLITLDERTQDLLLCDSGNARIARVNTLGPPVVTTFLDDQPNCAGLTFDALGYLYVFDAASGEVWVHPTDEDQGATVLAEEGKLWLGGFFSPYAMIFDRDDNLLVTLPDEDTILRLLLEDPIPAAPISLDVTHRLAGQPALDPTPDGALVTPEAVTWGQTLGAEAEDLRFTVAHELEGLEAGQVVTLSQGTTLRYQVGQDAVSAELPPVLAVVDHFVGLSPDRLELRKGTRQAVTLYLKNHRQTEDTVALRVEGLDAHISAELPASVVVPPLGEVTETLWLQAEPQAPLGEFQYAVRATSAQGGDDRVVGQVAVGSEGIKITVEADPPVITSGQTTNFKLRFEKAADDDRRGFTFDSFGLAGLTSNNRELYGLVDFLRGPVVTLDNPRAIFGRAGTHTFEIKLIPLGANADSAPVAVATGSITIAEEYGVQVYADPDVVYTGVGQPFTLTAVLRNDGVVPVDLRLDRCCGPAFWSPSFDAGPHRLIPGESKRVPIRMNPNAILFGEYTHRLDVVDIHDARIKDSFEATVFIEDLGGTLRFLAPKSVTASNLGTARLTARVERAFGSAGSLYRVEVESALGPWMVQSVQEVDLRAVSRRDVVLDFAGLVGLARGPWTVKVKAWAVERPEVVLEDVATITIPDGVGLGARFVPEDTLLTLGETVESQLVVDNWDFVGDGRMVEVFVESDDGGLVAEGGGLWPLVAGGSAQGVVRVTPSQVGLVEVRGRAEALDGAMAEAVWRLRVLDPANAPTITGSSFEPAPAEGVPFVWVVEAEDPNGDVLVFDADLDGDGAWDVEGASEGRFGLSFPDDAALALRVRVRDPEGGDDEREEALVVQNVAPVFASEPPGEGAQGELYEYAPVVVELGEDVVGLALVEGPEGASLEAGVLRWTPTRAQAREGRASFVVRASDEDGGSSEQAWEVVLSYPNDAPTAPTWIAPTEGEAVFGGEVLARWGLSRDSDGDPLSYEVELSRTEDFALLEASDAGLLPELGASELARRFEGLALDQAWWLRARARDLDEAGPWAVVSFQTPNRAPTRPTQLRPVDGARVEAGVVALTFSPAADPDGHAVEHRVRVYGDAGLLSEAYAETVAPQGGVATLAASFEAPDEARAWFWTVEAVDALGASSGVVGPEEFNVGQESVNRAPEAPVLVSPDDGARVLPEALALSVRAVADPDGDALRVSVWVWSGEEVVWEALDQALDDEGAWQGAPALPLGAYTWAARVVDARGLESPTTPTRSFEVLPADEMDTGDADDVGQDAGDVGDTDADVAEDAPEDADVAEDVAEDVSEDVAEDVSEDMAEDAEQDAKPDVVEDAAEDVTEDVAEDVSEDADAQDPIEVGGVGTEDDCGCDLSGAPARGWGWLALVALGLAWRARPRN